MLKHAPKTRDKIAKLIEGSVDEVVTEHMLRLSQEPQITSKVLDRLEQSLKDTQIGGYQVSVLAQDMPDRGPKSLEKKTGADIFIGIRVKNSLTGEDIAKGLLIQAKIEKNWSGKEQMKVVEQCLEMHLRSAKGAYLWVYGADGTKIIPANEVISNPYARPQELRTRKVSHQFREVLDCVAGDTAIANFEMFNDVAALNGKMHELAAKKAVAIELKLDGEYDTSMG